jgi:hypothetical protein
MTDETTDESLTEAQARIMAEVLAQVPEQPTAKVIGPAWTSGGGCMRCAETVQDPWNPGCPHGGHERAGESPLNLTLLDATLKRLRDVRRVLSAEDGTWRVVPAAPGASEAPQAPLWNQWAWRTVITDGPDWIVTEGKDELERCATGMCLAGWTGELDALPGEELWLVSHERLNEAGQQETFRDTLDIELASLLLKRPYDDPDAVHKTTTWNPRAEPADVVTAESRARRLLGFDRANQLALKLRMAGHLDIYAEDDLEYVTQSIFDGSNDLDALEDYAGRLRRLNEVLIAARAARAGDADATPAS